MLVMTEEDLTFERRTALANEIGRKLGLSFGLDGNVRKPFSHISPARLDDQFLADLPMWEVPFYVIARNMEGISEHRHVIDHAWWLIGNDRSGEPWGFVTEPYLDIDYAMRLARQTTSLHKKWGVVTECLPKAKSPWNPGSTVPIVTMMQPGYLTEFLNYGVGSALRAMIRGG
jgi:hypothetical protein